LFFDIDYKMILFLPFQRWIEIEPISLYSVFLDGGFDLSSTRTHRTRVMRTGLIAFVWQLWGWSLQLGLGCWLIGNQLMLSWGSGVCSADGVTGARPSCAREQGCLAAGFWRPSRSWRLASAWSRRDPLQHLPPPGEWLLLPSAFPQGAPRWAPV